MAKDRKCCVCTKEYDQKEKIRAYGKTSVVCLLNVCSAYCYTMRNGALSPKIDWNDGSILAMLDLFGKDVVSNPNMKNIKEWLEDYKIKING